MPARPDKIASRVAHSLERWVPPHREVGQ